MKNFFRNKIFSRKKQDVSSDRSPDAEQAVSEDKEKEKEEEKPSVYMRVSFATDPGKIRENNEDNFYIDGKYRHVYGQNESDCYIELTDRTHVFGLFDGMGGESFGETASALAAIQLDRIAPTLRQIDASELPFYMNEYSRRANNAICDLMAQRNAHGGSTFTAVCIKNGRAYPFYLGDSRIYLFDEGGLLQITEDQTLAVRKIKAGVYTEKEAENSPDHHILTCFLGVDNADMGLDCQPCMPIPIKPGVKLLLCSDGLTDMCGREEITEILLGGEQNPARALADRAIKNGGADNVTCVVVEFDRFF